MHPLLPTHTLSVGIRRPARDVYAFVSDPRNLPLWARAFCSSVSKTDDGWLIETPEGPMPIRFVEANGLGVLDHYVTTALGVEVYVPMRVLRNGLDCEVIFTLIRPAEMSDEGYAADGEMVERDLRTLKQVLE